MIYQNILDLIGNTPVVKHEDIYIKLESYNASGSVKDRAAKYMIEGLEQQGVLQPGKTIVEPTSGNTGISLAMIGAVKGYEVVLVMPDTMSVERQQAMKAYGAKLILTEGKKGMVGAIEEASRMVREKGYVMPQQFDNPNNVKAHEETTAKEIIRDFEELDYVIAGIGTGGTVTGIARTLKQHFPNVKIIGVEPNESHVINGGEKGSHGIQGVGAGFVPHILDLTNIDQVMMISTADAKEETKELAKKGIFLGISAGAAVRVAKEIKKAHPEAKYILAIAPDGGLKYLSTGVF